MSKNTNNNAFGVIAIIVLLLATIGVVYFISSKGNNLNIKNAFRNTNDEPVTTEMVAEISNIDDESANMLSIYKIIENEIRSQISNKSKASLDVISFYIKKNAQALDEGYDFYPYEIQTASGRVREEINGNEEFALIISGKNNIQAVDKDDPSDALEIGDKINIEGTLDIEASEYPFGRLFRIKPESDIEENSTIYYIIFQNEKSNKIFEDFSYKKVRFTALVSDISSDRIIYSYITGPTVIR